MWDEEPGDEAELSLQIRQVSASPTPTENVLDITIHSTRGDIPGVFHVVEGGTGAVIFVGGAMGGTEGPADRLWPRIATALNERSVSVLRLDYRQPNEFVECVMDVLAGASFLKGIGATDIVLAGHSFGAAVVIRAGELSPLVRGVAALSSQLYGTDSVDQFDRPLLLLHGGSDTVLHHEASEDIYRRAREPKELVLFEDTGHALVEAAPEVWDELLSWIPARLAGAPAQSGIREVRPLGRKP